VRVKRRELLVGLGALALSRRAWALEDDAATSDMARWVAGVAPFPGVAASAEWAAFARAEDARWARQSTRVRAIQDWAQRFIAPRTLAGWPVVYPFAGPDALHPLALFDAQRAFHLYGLERALPLPAPLLPPPAGYFDSLSGAMEELHRLTFFRTSELTSRLATIGVIPALLTILVRMGGTVTALSHAPEGRATLHWTHTNGSSRRLEYTRLDLSNDGLNAHGEVEVSLRRASPFVTFIKASSYLLADPRFSRLGHVLTEMSAALVQDDTGIPYRNLVDSWDVQLFGRYVAPRGALADHAQPDLEDAYHGEPHTPLPFGIGYNVAAGQSNLLLATRRRA
jgi:hypothetical protein